MKYILPLCLFPLPATAWDFTPDPICTLTHQTQAAEIAITYTPDLPEYALFITLRSGIWPNDPTFQMAFAGGQPGHIGTTRHSLSADGATLTVRDTGFSNVLDGIEFNTDLLATSGGHAITASTAGARDAVQAFRACPQTDPALS